MKTTRAYYIDWLRIIIVALLIPHHTAITFSHLGDTYVYLPIKDNALYFFIQSSFLNLWFMRMLFFISGISTFYALRKRTNKEYFIERCKKLLLPTVLALIFVCPAMGYFKAITLNNFHGSLLTFYPVFYKNIVLYLGWAHFWFLVYLFVFSIIFLLIRRIVKSIDTTAVKIGVYLSQSNRIIIPILLFIFFETLFRPFYPGFQTLVNDWANFAVYLSFFFFGYIIGSKQDLIDVIVSKIGLFAIIASISTISFIFLKYAQDNISLFSSYYNDMTYTYKLCLAFIQGISEYSLVLFIFGAAKLYLNRDNKIYRYLSKTSFTLYIFHFLIINMTMYFMIKLSWNHFIIYILSIFLVYSLFFILYEALLKRIPPLRYICGIQK
ncbi:MAG: acyltransferase [Bacteroidales bacterium]|nr:acyltransferase [Bacteroidales bacterium]